MERKILKASAGTGKTYRLSLECIVSLLEGEKTKDILVMTFTKKATAEIKERIIEFLTELYNKTEKGTEIGESIIKLYPEKFRNVDDIFLKVEKIYYGIILNKDSLKIFTIDGLKNLIFKKSIAPMLNINSYEIIDDFQNREYLKKCFEKIFLNKDDFSVLKKFLEINVERNIENYVDVIKNIIDERWKILSFSKEPRENYEINGNLYSFVDKSIDELESIKEKKGKPEETVKDFMKNSFHGYLNKGTPEDKEKFIYDNWKLFFDSDIKNGKKTGSTKKINVDDELEELSILREELLKELSKRIFNDTVIPNEREILSFIEKVCSIYDELKFREKKFTHQDITNYTYEYINDKKLNLTDENGITSYMKELLESDVTSVFIDEFQDTSIIQWKIFKPLVDSSSKVICVGDEKQSIYGWRGGEKNLFVNLDKILNGDVENLDTSYRSSKKIVEFTNEFFSRYSSYALEKDIKWGYEDVKSSKKEEEGYIEICDERESERGLEKVANIIQEKFEGNYKGIGILARNNDVLNEMAEILTEKNIPYFLETNLDIFSHRTILPIIKLLKYFITDNKFYLVEFLRDDFILIDDVLLKEILIFKDDINDFKFSDDSYNEVLKVVFDYKKKFEKNSFYNINLLTDLIGKLGILQKYSFEGDIQNVYDFIKISKRFDNISELLDEIKQNSGSSEYTQNSIEMKNAVILMTVHKSKGLEFNTVFYIHKENASKSETGIQFNVSMSKDYSVINESLIIDSKFERILKYLDKYDYAEEKRKKRDEEEINNLYVGLTRPKSNLFIIILKSFKESLMQKVISENYLLGEVKDFKNGSIKYLEKEKEKNYNFVDEDCDMKIDFSNYKYDDVKLSQNIEKIKDDELKFSLEREEKKHIGTIVHFYLENIINNSNEEREKAIQKTVSKYGVSSGKENILKLLNSEKLNELLEKNKIIFSDEWDLIYPEYEIYSDEKKELFRLDRVMIQKASSDKKGKVLVVDYKTGTFEESQLENYIYLVKQELSRIGELENYEVEGRYLQIEL